MPGVIWLLHWKHIVGAIYSFVVYAKCEVIICLILCIIMSYVYTGNFVVEQREALISGSLNR